MTTDIVSPAKRRQMMQAVRRHGTDIEIAARRAVSRLGRVCLPLQDGAGPACGRGDGRAGNSVSVATMRAPGAWQSTCSHVHYSREGAGARPSWARERAGRQRTTHHCS
jgi:hypothetical protein